MILEPGQNSFSLTDNTVSLQILDNDMLIKNISKPYLFVTLKHYYDKPKIYDITEFDVSVSDRSVMSSNLTNVLRSQSLIGTNFALENAMEVNRMDFDWDAATETLQSGMVKYKSDMHAQHPDMMLQIENI